MRKVNKEIAKKILELHGRGYSYNKIALELDLDVTTVYRTIKKIRELGEGWEKHFEQEKKERPDKKIVRYFHTAKSLIKKLPKSIVKKILESYGEEA